MERHGMSRRAFIGAALGAALSARYAQGETQRPNILFILTDDQASWTLGCYGNGDAHTPNLDKFFAESVRLTNCFVVTPVCSPSRASLMTSRYGTEVGITDWIDPKKEPKVGLSPDYVTWPEVLASAGYQTALIGKWHLGTEDRFHPTKQGYQYFAGFRAGGVTPTDPELEVDGLPKKETGVADNILTDYAVDRLKAFDKKKPFLLSVHYRWPHAPWQPLPDEDWAPFKDAHPKLSDYPNLDVEKANTSMKEYLSACTGVDRNVGRLLRTLEELGIADNTIVVFTGDNGYNVGQHGILHKGNASWMTLDVRDLPQGDERRYRPNIFDNSIRVPGAVRWPGVINPGQICDKTVSFLDWFPTLLAMAGVPLPDGVTLYGRNALPVLKGESVPWENDMYAEYSQHHYTRADLRMYRTPEWKLVRDFLHPERDELYHLATDPGETRNLIADPDAQAIRKQLDEKLLAKMKSLKDSALGSLANPG